MQETELNQSVAGLQSLFRSGLSVRVLVALSDNPQEVRRLSAECKSSPGAVITTLHRLHQDGLVEVDKKMWALSNCGSLLKRKIVRFIRLFQDIETNVPGHAHSLTPGDVHTSQKSFHSIVLSGHTIRILLALQEGDTTPEQLRRIIGARTSTLRPLLNRLNEMGYLTEHGGAVSLKAEGRRIVSALSDLLRIAEFIRKKGTFWNDHFVECLPGIALDTIFDLKDTDIIYDTPETMVKNYERYFTCVSEADWIIGISDWVTTKLSDEYTKPIMAGTPIEMIYPEEITYRLFQAPYIEKTQNLDLYPNFKIRVAQCPTPFGLTVTNSMFIIKLYAKDGENFTTARLRAYKVQEAAEWGKRVFDYYREQSIPVEEFLSQVNQGKTEE